MLQRCEREALKALNGARCRRSQTKAHERFKLSCNVSDDNFNILNLSNRILSPSEIKLLSRGLSFVPKPRLISKDRLLSDYEQFVKKLRLRYWFRGQPRSESKFRRKSSFQPKLTNNATLESVIKQMRDQLSDLTYEQSQGLLRTLLSIYIYIYIYTSVLQIHPGMERAHDGGDLPYEEPWQGMALTVSGLCCVYGETPARKKYWGPLMIWYTTLEVNVLQESRISGFAREPMRLKP